MALEDHSQLLLMQRPRLTATRHASLRLISLMLAERLINLLHFVPPTLSSFFIRDWPRAELAAASDALFAMLPEYCFFHYHHSVFDTCHDSRFRHFSCYADGERRYATLFRLRRDGFVD